MHTLTTPLNEKDIAPLKAGDQVMLHGRILCGRDAVLPRIVARWRAKDASLAALRLEGSVIFHTAVSVAGVGPTSSNKPEIEESIPELSAMGVRLHLGKGALSPATVEALQRHGSVYAVTPPTSALFSHHTVSQKVLAYPELGMEALYEIEITGFPTIIAIAHGKTIFG